jgi:hypothetical protein
VTGKGWYREALDAAITVGKIQKKDKMPYSLPQDRCYEHYEEHQDYSMHRNDRIYKTSRTL